MTGVLGTCQRCLGPPPPGHSYCEECGRDLRAEPGGRWWSSTAPPGPCRVCGCPRLSREGFCEDCGRRPGVGQDQAELHLPVGSAITHKGLRKPRNEDAVALGSSGEAILAVVCDGVSSSDRADEAAHSCVDTAIVAGLAAVDAGAGATGGTGAAVEAASIAVAALVTAETAASPPSCTYVSAVVTTTEVVAGWLGDSRAYWLVPEAPEESRLLTEDHSVAGRLARWLGADAGDTVPAVTTVRPDRSGMVLLCSDGLSRYLSEPAQLAAAAGGDPAAAVRALCDHALHAGGVDNIAIVLIPFPPTPKEPS